MLIVRLVWVLSLLEGEVLPCSRSLCCEGLPLLRFALLSNQPFWSGPLEHGLFYSFSATPSYFQQQSSFYHNNFVKNYSLVYFDWIKWQCKQRYFLVARCSLSSRICKITLYQLYMVKLFDPGDLYFGYFYFKSQSMVSTQEIIFQLGKFLFCIGFLEKFCRYVFATSWYVATWPARTLQCASDILGNIFYGKIITLKSHTTWHQNSRKVHMYAFGKPILIGHTFSIN